MRVRELFAMGLAAFGIAGCHQKAAIEEAHAPEAVLSVEMAKVTPHEMRETVPLDGTYSYRQGDYARLAPAVAGRLSKVLVKQGERVKRGQLLAQIDLSVLSAQQRSADLASGSSRQQAVQAAEALRASKLDVEAQIRAADLALQAAVIERDTNVQSAQANLDRLLAGARPQEIGQAEQAVKQARVTRDRAKQDADRDQSLLKEGYVSGQQAQASAAAFELADSALKQAEQQLELVRLGARPEEVRAAKAQLAAAKDLGMKKVEAARAALSQAKQGKVALLAKTAEAEAAKLASAQKNADAVAAAGATSNGEIRAPYDGVVTRRNLNPGDSVDPTTPVLELVRVGSKIEFSGMASASSAARISRGMLVLDEEGKELGTVASIGILDPQSGLAPVQVTLTALPDSAISGKYARLSIVFRNLGRVPSVPEPCVVNRDDKFYVFRVEQGVAHLKEVQVGPSYQGQVAITKGASNGDVVVSVGQHEISDGAKVTKQQAQENK